MPLSDASKAGALLFVGVAQFGILIIMAEAVSPTYSVADNYISDLGKIFPNSAVIFNPSIFFLGITILASAFFLNKAFRWKPGTVLYVIAGVGPVGVGLFPEGSPFGLHSIFSLVTFVFIGLTAIAMAKFERRPLSFFSIALGVLTLSALALYVPGGGVTYGSTLGIGPGGLERLIVYPVLMWGTAFSGYLMGLKDIAKDAG